jgi:hypothetical protein
MLDSRHIAPALLIGCVILLCASPAFASGPAPVTVRVEGVAETKLEATQVTTSTEPVVKDGKPEDSCSGTSALGALQLATGGNWNGAWSGSFHQYFIESIEGEGEAVGGSLYYWSFWVNDRFQEVGACAVEPQAGDRVLFFPICYEACPGGAEPTPLEVQAPDSANVGEAVGVTVVQYNTAGEPSPAAGATIASSGPGTSTDSQGHASLTFSAAGTYQLQVAGAPTGPPSVRTETSITVNAGNDGNSGTRLGSSSSTTTQSSGTTSQTSSGSSTLGVKYSGPYAVLARATGVIDGHDYPRGHGPRVLTGSALAHAAVTSVSIELRRRYKGRCYAYDGVAERFRRARCGSGKPFKVASGATFSYLLPQALAPGRYVLDLHATDAAGNRTRLARGTSRIVFYVG